MVAAGDRDAIVAVSGVEPDLLRLALVEDAAVADVAGLAVGLDETRGQLEIAIGLPIGLHDLRAVGEEDVGALGQMRIEALRDLFEAVAPPIQVGCQPSPVDRVPLHRHPFHRAIDGPIRELGAKALAAFRKSSRVRPANNSRSCSRPLVVRPVIPGYSAT